MRRAALFVLLAVVSAAFVAPASARAQAAQVIRLGPEQGCELGPTDIPGVPVSIPADCLVVVTPSGNANILVRAELPAGFTLGETFIDEQACGFPGLALGSGHVVATRSGQITAQCHIRATG